MFGSELLIWGLGQGSRAPAPGQAPWAISDGTRCLPANAPALVVCHFVLQQKQSTSNMVSSR